MTIKKELEHEIIEYLKDNPIIFYYDYNDKLNNEQIERIFNGKIFDVEEEIIEYNYDYECILVNELKNQIYELFNIDNDIIEIDDLIYENVIKDYNIKELYNNTKANIRIDINSNYEMLDNTDFRYYEDTYLKQILKLFQIDPREFIIEFNKYFKCQHDINEYPIINYDKSYMNIYDLLVEIDNLLGGNYAKLCFYGYIYLSDYIDLFYNDYNFNNFKSITIKTGNSMGLINSWNGYGSNLKLNNSNDITINNQYGDTIYDTINIVLDTSNKYGITDIYGNMFDNELSFALHY